MSREKARFFGNDLSDLQAFGSRDPAFILHKINKIMIEESCQLDD